jgi:DtxR family Mn-dependent transcriptional regulator
MAVRRKSELTRSLEDYLETIYDLVRNRKLARVKDIAKLRGVKPGSVSPAMRRLADLGLIRYEQREFIDLTAKGEARARRVVARHQILNTFFHDILKMPTEAAERDACAMEHTLSAEAMDRLTGLVEFLKTDPRIEADFLARFGGKQAAAKRRSAKGARRQPTAADLEPGEEAVVKLIRARGKQRRRLLESGILPDAVIRMERRAARGKGFVVDLQGFRVTIDRADAATVVVARRS